MKRWFMRCCGVAFIGYIVLCIALYFVQRSFMYFPTKSGEYSERSSIVLEVADASLRVSVRPKEGPLALIYFGGNAEDVSQSLIDYSTNFPEHAIYMLHYRGYSGSTGYPTEQALHADAQNLFDMVSERHSQIALIGRSLGSGIAVRLAANNPVERLVLITPYDSMMNVAREKLPWLPVTLLMVDRFESWRIAPEVKVPTLILAAADDVTVPMSRTQSLLLAFLPVATMRVLEGVDHDSITSSPEYMSTILAGR